MAKLSGREEYPFYFGAKPKLLRIASELRHSTTEAEKNLWKQIRNRKLMGYRFRRQHPINEVVVDFFCFEAMLAIELDGSVHNDAYQKERDKERTDILKRFGIKVIRFENEQVKTNIGLVLDLILSEIKRFSKRN